MFYVHIRKKLDSTNEAYASVGIFQNKLMEEKNTVLMQTNVSLEEELRKANATKGQLETYKRQVPNQQQCWLSQAKNIIYVTPGWTRLLNLLRYYVMILTHPYI